MVPLDVMTALKDLKSCTRQVVGAAVLSTSVKLNDDYMTGGPNIPRLSHKIAHASAVADHVISNGHNIKRDHFGILASGKSD